MSDDNDLNMLDEIHRLRAELVEAQRCNQSLGRIVADLRRLRDTAELHLSAWKAEAEAWRRQDDALTKNWGMEWTIREGLAHVPMTRQVKEAMARTDELTGGQHA